MPVNNLLLIAESVIKPRKPYTRPHLRVLGDLRSLTLGGSPGIGESGGFIRKTASGFLPPPATIPPIKPPPP